jgi:hemin uptake protein HemP
MSTLTLPMSQPREVTRRRLSLRRVVVATPAEQTRRERDMPAPSAMDTVRSAVAALPAKLEALVRDSKPASKVAAADAVPLDVLMHGATTLPILHNGEVYILRKTRYGKLILTK